MRRALDSSNLREALRHCESLLNELRLEDCSPKEYYSLFSLAFDELCFLRGALATEQARKPRPGLRDSVQYCRAIVPRLYLLVAVSSCLPDPQTLPETSPSEPAVVGAAAWDALKLLRGVQHPLRGLFLRYWFVKAFKSTFEDMGEGPHVSTAIDLLLTNLKEANLLWIRVNSLVSEKQKRREARKELALTVGENLFRLAALEGLDIELYRSSVLPRWVEILLENPDKLAQEYLFDCALSSFPADFHMATIGELLEAVERFSARVDRAGPLQKLFDRVAGQPGAAAVFPQLKAAAVRRVQVGREKERDKSRSESTGSEVKNRENLLRGALVGLLRFALAMEGGVERAVGEVLELVEQVVQKEGVVEVDWLSTVLELPVDKLGMSALKIPGVLSLSARMPPASTRKASLALLRTATRDKATRQETTRAELQALLKFVAPLMKDAAGPAELSALAALPRGLDANSPAETLCLVADFVSALPTEAAASRRVCGPPLLERLTLLLVQQTLRDRKEPAGSVAAADRVDPIEAARLFDSISRDFSPDSPAPIPAVLDFASAMFRLGSAPDLASDLLSRALSLLENEVSPSSKRLFLLRRASASIASIASSSGSSPAAAAAAARLATATTLLPRRADQATELAELARVFALCGLRQNAREALERAVMLLQVSAKFDPPTKGLFVRLWEKARAMKGVLEEGELKELEAMAENAAKGNEKIGKYFERCKKGEVVFWDLQDEGHLEEHIESGEHYVENQNVEHVEEEHKEVGGDHGEEPHSTE